MTIFTNGLEFFRDEKFGQAVRPGKDGFLSLTNSNMYCLTVGDYLFSKFNTIDNFHDFYTE